MEEDNLNGNAEHWGVRVDSNGEFVCKVNYEGEHVDQYAAKPQTSPSTMDSAMEENEAYGEDSEEDIQHTDEEDSGDEMQHADEEDSEEDMQHADEQGIACLIL
ncbi:hypothetical protein TrRE_jg7401 [Triparma retinervis]|uniref:Uncharacterized protein n=1 Tax=Triparma retinervis TaxID=2557542 RepID=A0A9W6ZJW6_9STRA|nr:hypothetical protein TrRE_jg7401 [Triparma retinervis]